MIAVVMAVILTVTIAACLYEDYRAAAMVRVSVIPSRVKLLFLPWLFMGVSEKLGVPYCGVLIMRILLFRVPY